MLKLHSDNMRLLGKEVLEPNQRLQEVFSQILQKLEGGEYEFVNILQDKSVIEKAGNVVSRAKEWADTVVVIGTGGSDLGARAIRQALASEAKSQTPNLNVLFHGSSLDPYDIDWLSNRVDLSRTVFNIVSKSGQTLETMAQYAYWKEEVREMEEWQKHFIFTTDPEKGTLRKEAEKHGIATLDIPPGIGGRFSVLSVVGLLAAAALGIDSAQLIAGASDTARETISQGKNSIAFQIASQQFQFYKQGIKTVVFMPYSTRLNEFARWFRQLWGESLSKDGKGILPIQARGPADQHSQLQFYTQGELLSSFLFLRIKDHVENKYRIGQVDVEGLEYLSGKEFGEMLNIAQQATETSLTNAGRPNATLEIDTLDPWHLGALFMTFELAVVFLAGFLMVNPFNQPGVEESKRLMREMVR